MELGALKPILASLALPPLSLIVLGLLGLILVVRKKRLGLTLVTLALALLWLASCNGTAVWLARTAVPQFAPLSLATLKASKAQAIVVLGGGLLPEAPEYGNAQPAAHSASRLRYGLWLGRQTGLPLAFTGGAGWAARQAPNGAKADSEADVAARMALQDYGFTLRWLESQSRDTAENARLLAPMLQRDGVKRIVLVTDAWHMPRSVLAFEQTGLLVVPGPTGYILPERSDLMEWLPSASGLLASQQVLREWLALAVARRSGT